MRTYHGADQAKGRDASLEQAHSAVAQIKVSALYLKLDLRTVTTVYQARFVYESLQ